MKKVKTRCTIRLTDDEIKMIEQYPGKSFSGRIRSLLAAHSIMLNEISGDDLKEKYEIILNSYLKNFHPMLNQEIQERRKELRRYTDTLKELDELNEMADELEEKMRELCSQSKSYIEQKVAECVVVRKNTERISR